MKNKNTQPGFHLYRSIRKTEFYWFFYSTNGRVISVSDGNYKSKQAAITSIKSILSTLGATDRCLYYDHTGKEVNLFVIK